MDEMYALSPLIISDYALAFKTARSAVNFGFLLQS